jgi:hypothetical protein
MTPRLILHIGTEKTGSTAIQRFLADHHEWLWDQGYAVPRSLGAVEHRRFTLFCYRPDQQDDITNTEGLEKLSADERLARLNCWKQELDNELAQAPDHSWIISSEHIHSRILHHESSMAALVSFIESRFMDVLVIVYLREPLSAALSLWSTAVLNGAALPDLPLPDNEYWNRLCCHQATLAQLEKWFPGHFQPRLFTPESWIDGDVIRDFTQATGIELPTDYQTAPQRANTSLSWLSLSLIAQLNQEGHPSRDLVRAIRESFDHLPSPMATTNHKRAYRKAYFKSNEWVRQNYFSSLPTLFNTL